MTSRPFETAGDAWFPETQTAILTAAARGNWTEFFDRYVKPCWREIALSCRRHGLPIDDSDEIAQELALRLMRNGTARPPAERDFGGDVRKIEGNIPARFLTARCDGQDVARFRTFLKQVIANLVREHLRKRARMAVRETPLDHVDENRLAETISVVINRRWIAEALFEAALALKHWSETAKTRGQKRLFAILRASVVENLTATEIADRLKIDRTNVSELLKQARQRFVMSLEDITGITDREELQNAVSAAASHFVLALARTDSA